MNQVPSLPFPWPNREVGLRRFARAIIFGFGSIVLTIAAAINNVMLYSSEDSINDFVIETAIVAVLFGLEMWLTVVRRHKSAFVVLKYTAYAGLIASFAFDLYFCWSAYELGPNFSFLGNDANVNSPALTIFLALSSNIATLVATYNGIRNDWFYAAADNDSWG